MTTSLHTHIYTLYMHDIRKYIHIHGTQVHQDKPDGDDETLGIDGKMLNIVLQNDCVVCLAASPESGKPEDQVIEACFANAAGALIDAGALLAGIGNRNIAEAILSRMTNEACPYRGVIFYDVALRSWRIRARDGQEWSKSASPIPERECFALFDELRCRGADLKLAHNAVAVVTVGARMCKDKLMQACGRMRRLTEGQKLVFVVSSDAVVQIRDMQKRNVKAEGEGGESVRVRDGGMQSGDVQKQGVKVEGDERTYMRTSEQADSMRANGPNVAVRSHDVDATYMHTSDPAESMRANGPNVVVRSRDVEHGRLDVVHLLQWVMHNTIQVCDYVYTHVYIMCLYVCMCV